MNGLINKCILTVVMICVFTGTPSAQSITWLGGLSDRGSYPNAVSADGRVVVGNSSVNIENRHAFRWENGDMQDLGTLGGNSSNANAISHDGRVIVGFSYDADENERSFRWMDGNMEDIGSLGGSESIAYGVSADGSVIVGESINSANQGRAYRWTENSMQDIGTLNNLGTGARSVNDDGSVIVGTSLLGGSARHAFRWVNGNMQDLGSLGNNSEAFSVSGDGSVVVGRSIESVGFRAFRWTSSLGMENLGTIGGNNSEANAVSANGEVIVGISRDEDSNNRAFRWTETDGMENLNLVFEDLLSDGSYLIVATDASSDGRFIIGYGYNATDDSFEGFILDTEESTGTHLVEDPGLPSGYNLAQNYPNPFNPATVISFEIPEAGSVSIEVFSMLGQRVAILADAHHAAGTHDVVFDASELSSGLYIYRMHAGAFTATRKLMLIR